MALVLITIKITERYNLGKQVSRHMRLSTQGSCSQPWPRSRRVTRSTYYKLLDNINNWIANLSNWELIAFIF